MKAYILVKSYIAGKENNMPGWYIGTVCLDKAEAEAFKAKLMADRTDLNDVWFICERDLIK